jgi:hypothetical protein
MSSPVAANGSQFINNDTVEQINKYIDSVCSNPTFLCNNKDLCGKNSTLYSDINNVNTICSQLTTANECENNFNECVVLVKNMFEESHQYISSSFVNIIVPISNSVDSAGNQKFLRFPALSGTKKQGSLDTCNICMCMNRFAQSPGSSNNTATSPGQNQCVYPDSFEYYYYPLDIEYINSKLFNPPPITLGGYNIINSNIIYAHSEEDLQVGPLYDILINNGITQQNATTFILNVLYSNNTAKANELNVYINNKANEKLKLKNLEKYYKNITFYYVLFTILLILLIIV